MFYVSHLTKNQFPSRARKESSGLESPSQFKAFSQSTAGVEASDPDNKYRTDDGINYSYRKEFVWDMSIETRNEKKTLFQFDLIKDS